MTPITCRLTAKNRDQLWIPTLCNREWTTFTFLDKRQMFLLLAQASLETAMESAFGGNLSSYKAIYVGSHPPSNGRWESWLSFTSESPYPIRYSLKPLTELLDSDHFKGSDEATLNAKKARLVSFPFQFLPRDAMHPRY